MENQIIIIYPYRFRAFDRNRYEVDYLKQHTNVVIHELIEILHPNFAVAYHEIDGSNDVIRFSNLDYWKKEYVKNIRNFEGKTYVINLIPVSTFKELIVNYVISSSSVFLIKFDTIGVMSYGDIPRSYFDKVRSKILFLLKRASLKWLYHSFFASRIFRNLDQFFCRKADYLISVGKKNNQSSTKLIQGNSFDYSMTIREQINSKFRNYNHGTIIFLDTGAPLFKTDSYMFGNKVPLTKELWYPSLRNFFNMIENKTSNKVVIAAHPKHKYSTNNAHYFGDREIINHDTMGLVSKASLVLVTNSTSVSYAVIFKKPVLVLSSNEIINDGNVIMDESKYLSSILGCPIINIDEIDQNLLSNLSVNKDKYLAYRNKYLSSRPDIKSNGEIIISEILNKELPLNSGV